VGTAAVVVAAVVVVELVEVTERLPDAWVELVLEIVLVTEEFLIYMFIQDDPPQYSFGLALQGRVQTPLVDAAEPDWITFPQ
jgi:hypothetical protein